MKTKLFFYFTIIALVAFVIGMFIAGEFDFNFNDEEVDPIIIFGNTMSVLGFIASALAGIIWLVVLIKKSLAEYRGFYFYSGVIFLGIPVSFLTRFMVHAIVEFGSLHGGTYPMYSFLWWSFVSAMDTPPFWFCLGVYLIIITGVLLFIKKPEKVKVVE